jgi:hypothetical protein
MPEYQQTGPAVEMEAKTLLCAVCRNARSYQPAAVTEWVCGNCARLGLVWAAKRALMPWWHRLFFWRR